ncbi:MAG: hypothetical protein LIR25_06695 [bacterium]|nr:hypothetical protein [bacterium]
MEGLNKEDEEKLAERIRIRQKYDYLYREQGEPENPETRPTNLDRLTEKDQKQMADFICSLIWGNDCEACPCGMQHCNEVFNARAKLLGLDPELDSTLNDPRLNDNCQLAVGMWLQSPDGEFILTPAMLPESSAAVPPVAD